MRTLSDLEYVRRSELLKKHIPTRRPVEVRDAMVILGIHSTSAARYTLMHMVEMGLLDYEPPKDKGYHRKGKFFLKEDHSHDETK